MRVMSVSIGLIGSYLLTACGVEPPSFENGLPPLAAHLECLPEEAAMISAHRATARDWNGPENAISGLEKLAAQGYLMAEIDVASVKGGRHILFHDGVWDEVSTGQGAVASSANDAPDTILLKSRRGKLSDQRPPDLEAALRAAKGKLYLEIDFKSSANYKVVIAAIREAGMADQVILISYNKAQRARLKSLAPDMLISAGPGYAGKHDLLWLGRDVRASKGQYVIGRIGPPENERGLTETKRHATILVTDDANRYLPVTGLTKAGRGDYVECLRTL